MRLIQATLLLAFIFFSQTGYGADEKIQVPVFVIEVSLSSEAREKITMSGESIKGSIYFDGDGTPLPDVKTAPLRDVFLGKYEFELEKEGSITINNASISKEAYERLKDKNYHYFVNIYSGRRVFENNILNGGYSDGRLEDLLAGKKIIVFCDLL
jgi:hypothetical protein